jgi:hypothetical protein
MNSGKHARLDSISLVGACPSPALEKFANISKAMPTSRRGSVAPLPMEDIPKLELYSLKCGSEGKCLSWVHYVGGCEISML